jgi:hypothetical protein
LDIPFTPENMQKIAAIYDGTPEGRDSLYLSLHAAARLGARLLVLLPAVREPDQSPAEWSEKIHTAGGAAGIQVETREMSGLTAPAILEQAQDISTLLLPVSLLENPELLPELALSLGCPVWVVPRLMEIRQLAGLLQTPEEPEVSRYATALAQRLESPLLFFTTGEANPKDGGAPRKTLPELSPAMLAQQVELEHIDLLIFAEAQAPLLQSCASLLTCLMVLCPPRQAAMLN